MRRGAVAAALLAALGASCARVAPVSRPTPDGTARVYAVGGLRFEAPASWSADGDARRLKLVAPGGDAVVEVKATATPGKAADCLADADAALERGAASLSDVRRHASTFGGKKAIAQEAEHGGWHGWAWATCAGGEQYRVFLAGRAPVSRETIEAQRRLVASARIGGAP